MMRPDSDPSSVKDDLKQGEQFFIGIVIAALVDNGSGALKKSSIYNGGEDTIRSNPGVAAD